MILQFPQKNNEQKEAKPSIANQFFQEGQRFFLKTITDALQVLKGSIFRVEVTDRPNVYPVESPEILSQIQALVVQLEAANTHLQGIAKSESIEEVSTGVTEQTKALVGAISGLTFPDPSEKIEVTNLQKLESDIALISKQTAQFVTEIQKLDISPTINLPAQDLSPLLKEIQKLQILLATDKGPGDYSQIVEAIKKYRHTGGSSISGRTNPGTGDLRVAFVNYDGTDASPLGSRVLNGQKAVVSNAATQFTATSTPILNGLIITALSTNSGSVYVGGAGVTSSNGAELQAGQSTSVAINDISKMWVTGTTGDKVCWITTD